MGIPVIDLFAGPGGLGEGFSSIWNARGGRLFDIRLSIEKDKEAHKTLLLRSFYRQFPKDSIPELYYRYITENNPKKQKELLVELKVGYSKQWNKAKNEAWNYELPYPEEFDKKGVKKGGYKLAEIQKKNLEIDKRISKALPKTKEFLLIGGPPCQAYSLVGRARNKGILNKDHRVHLYKEYLRIIAKHRPAVFVMENVKGLLSAKIDDIKVFDVIKEDLKHPSNLFPQYNPSNYRVYSFVKNPDGYDLNGFPYYKNNIDYLIRAESYSIPQKRHRVILLGIREDLNNYKINSLKKRPDEINLHQIIGSLPEIRSGIGREIIGINPKGKNIYKSIKNTKSNWSTAIIGYARKLDKKLSDQLGDLLWTNKQGANFCECDLHEKDNPIFNGWYSDERLNGVLNHQSRTHLKEDLGRYLFSSLYLKVHGEFPRMNDYPARLLPNHANVKDDKFADRFRTQKPDKPATTITSHISKDGHYYIHYDPKQCRSLTVREAARIQTFPDNYYFCGNQTTQYHQVGNAVPPFLAKQLAEIVFNIFKKNKKKPS